MVLVGPINNNVSKTLMQNLNMKILSCDVYLEMPTCVWYCKIFGPVSDEPNGL